MESTRNEDIVEIRKDIENFTKLAKENPTYIKQLCMAGMKTEFWKFVRCRLQQTLDSAEANTLRKNISTMDDTISLAKWIAIYKTADELLNFLNNVVSIEIKTNVKE